MSINWTTTVNPIAGKNYTIPTYGNYGGPGFSGGKLLSAGEDADYSKPPVDALDNLFRTHDQAYGAVYASEAGTDPKQFSQQHKNDLANADLIVIKGILALSSEQLSTNDSQAYAGAVIYAFINSNIKETYGAGALISAIEEQSYTSFANKSFVTGFITNPDNVIEDFIDNIGLFKLVIDNAPQAITDVSNVVGDVIKNLAQQGLAKADELLQLAAQAINETIDDATVAAKTISNTATQLVNDGIVTATDAVNAVAQAVSNTIDDVEKGITIVQTTLDKLIEVGIYNSQEFIEDFINNAGNWIGDAADSFQDAIAVALRRFIDPISIDMDGDGIELMPRSSSGIFFDMDGDGVKESTGWLAKDDAFLVLDANQNGKIDSISEMIGDQNQSGFTELLTYDFNNDKTFNADDANWSQMQLWQDANSNGITEKGELLSLLQAGIDSIDLNYTTVGFTAEGNQIHESSVFEKVGGGTGTIVDAWFDSDNVARQVNAKDTGNTTIDNLPDIRSYGDVLSLHEAMDKDIALTTLVNTLVNLKPDQLESVKETTQQILFRWAKTTNIATDSRGVNFDGQKLATIEKFLGTPYLVNGSSDPTTQAVPNLTNTWDNIVDGVLSRLLLAGTLKSHLPATVYNLGEDKFISFGNIDSIIAGVKEGQPQNDTLARAYYWSAAIPTINRLAEDADIDIATQAHRDKISSALNEIGLGKFQDVLYSGITNVTAINATALDKNGIYRLSDNANNVYLEGDTKAIFAVGGNDKIVSLTTWYNTVMLDGGEGNDFLQASESADWLEGGKGSDTLIGLNGNDTYFIDNINDVVKESRSEGTDTVQSKISYTLDDNVEYLVLQGTNNLNGTGNNLNNSLVGNKGANLLTGNEGYDTLDGGAGIDTLVGGIGDDTYFVDNNADVVIEAYNAGADTIQSSASYVLSKYVENLTLLGTEALNATGNNLNNTIRGNTGNNILDGKQGNDDLRGGLGDDTYIIDSSSDYAAEDVDAGIDSVNSNVSYSLSSNIEKLTLTGDIDIYANGNDLANFIIGNTGANSLDGRAGIDTLKGGNGDDTYTVDNSDDVIIEQDNQGIDSVTSYVSYVLSANVENLTLTGSAALDGIGNAVDNIIIGTSDVNSLVGGGGNDILNGKENVDTLEGGEGNDIYFVDNSGDIIIEKVGAGIDTVQSSVSWILDNSLEDLTLLGSSVIDAWGNASDNTLIGNSAANVLDGKAGIDTMLGFSGDDTYLVDNILDTAVENYSEGIDTVQSIVSYTLVNNIEYLVLQGTKGLSATGNSLNNSLIGNNGANLLTGNQGNDTLDGSSGIDTLAGGVNDDTYIIDNNADVVIEIYNAGIDTIQSSVSYTLSKYVENLTLLGTKALNGTGNSLDNRIIGNEGNNILNGKQGNDAFWGGLGDDTYIIDGNESIYEDTDAGIDSVNSSISYSLDSNIENLTLTGSAYSGTGNSLDNLIIGNADANELSGGAGVDTLKGGEDDDHYTVDNSGDVVIEKSDQGIDSITSSVNYVLKANIENLILTGDAFIGGGNILDNIIIGTSTVNKLKGSDGNDILDGKEASDTLDGGNGNDVYIVDTNGDSIIEADNAGTDNVQSSVSWVLGGNLENLTLTGWSAIDGWGNSLKNRLIGNDAANVLDGKAGADTLQGFSGNDIYLVDTISDVIIETRNEGDDIVKSSSSYVLSDNLEQLFLQLTGDFNATGNALNNVIIGNDGANIINGNEGNDTLTGSSGSDIFQFVTAGGFDTIIDFNTKDDTLQLENSIFTSLGAEGILASAKLKAGSGITAAADSNDYLLYNSTDGKLYYDSDAVGGASSPILIAIIGANLALTNNDFVII